MTFNPTAPVRARVPSVGTSTSPILARSVPNPSRSVSASYASAITTSPRGRPVGFGQTAPAPLFEPRIIRAAASPTPARDIACNPPYSPTSSPSRPRRWSSGVRPQASHGTVVPTQHRPPVVTNVGHATAQGFPRPAYLEYSSLRDMLYTEPPPLAHPTTRPAPSYSVSTHDSRSSASPAPPVMSYPILRRELTPALDSDDDSIATPSPPSVGAVTVISTNTVLMLPTRWSDQDRTPALSVSSDGRELMFTGPSSMGDRDSSAARANHTIPPACGIYYYEVEILHRCPQGWVVPCIAFNCFADVSAGPSALGGFFIAWAGRDADLPAQIFRARSPTFPPPRMGEEQLGIPCR